jgi:hypothetical protein
VTRPFWQQGFIYVADETGAEVKGSRRSLAGCETMADYRKLWLDLDARTGEGCTVRHGDGP